MTMLSSTMITGFDGLDLQCFRTRLEAAIVAFDAFTGTTQTKSDFLGITTSMGPLTTNSSGGRLTLTVGRIDELKAMTIGMPQPQWWPSSEEPRKEDASRILNLLAELVESRCAAYGKRINSKDTGLDELPRAIGAVLSAEGVDPSTCPDLVVTPKLPYEHVERTHRIDPSICIDAKSRTGMTSRKRALSAEAEAAIVDRHRAFRLSMKEARAYSIDLPPSIAMKACSSDSMDMLRVMQDLALNPGKPHVLKAARGS